MGTVIYTTVPLHVHDCIVSIYLCSSSTLRTQKYIGTNIGRCLAKKTVVTHGCRNGASMGC